MPKLPKAAHSAILPQYQSSAAFMERFLDAIYDEKTEIERSPNRKGIKLVDGTEIDADYFDYFLENKRDLELEFRADLKNKLGQNKADLFCEIVASDWHDGKGLRDGPRVLSLKSSVKGYLRRVLKSTWNIKEIVQNDALPHSAPLLNEREIAGVLTVNDQMMIRHVEAWKARHVNANQITTDDIFLRRGLSLDRPLDKGEPYREWDYINSYSIAISAPEKFAQMQFGKIPALVSGDLDLFSGRILFFSPFIPMMEAGQLEAGVIPADGPIPIKAQGTHGGILEYIIGERPETPDALLDMFE